MKQERSRWLHYLEFPAFFELNHLARTAGIMGQAYQLQPCRIAGVVVSRPHKPQPSKVTSLNGQFTTVIKSTGRCVLINEWFRTTAFMKNSKGLISLPRPNTQDISFYYSVACKYNSLAWAVCYIVSDHVMIGLNE